jgi:hypothetical protein
MPNIALCILSQLRWSVSKSFSFSFSTALSSIADSITALISYASEMSSAANLDTYVPDFSRWYSTPSSTSRLTASLIGVRLTPQAAASDGSESLLPGFRSPLASLEQMKSYACWFRLLVRMFFTDNIIANSATS